MADYQLTAPIEPCAVIRHSDGACIPPDMANRDYNGSLQSPGYLQWLADGGVPDPYVEPPPPPPPPPSPEDAALYNHENRIRGLEGTPPMPLPEFLAKMKGGL